MPGICPAATGNECSISHEAQLTPFNTTGGVYKTLSPFCCVNTKSCVSCVLRCAFAICRVRQQEARSSVLTSFSSLMPSMSSITLMKCWQRREWSTVWVGMALCCQCLHSDRDSSLGSGPGFLERLSFWAQT